LRKLSLHLDLERILPVQNPNRTVRTALGAVLMALLLSVGLATVATPASASSLTYQMDPNDQLVPSGGRQILYPPAGTLSVSMDPDGQLRIYWGNANLHVMFEVGNHIPGTIAKMQGDGNFVLIAPGNHPIWATGTNGHPGTVAQIQNDGGFALYAPGHVFLKWISPPF
jgi:hypothetical protein